MAPRSRTGIAGSGDGGRVRNSFTLKATGGLGTNVAGGSLRLAGGKGTGYADAGVVGVQYPPRGASGSTLQSLSSNTYPMATSIYATNAGVTVANTTTDTSLFATAVAGATRTIEAGMARVGQIYRVTINFNISTTGAPTGRLRIKAGSSTVAAAFTTAGQSSRGRITCDLWGAATAATRNINTSPLSMQYADSTTFDANSPCERSQPAAAQQWI